MSHPTPTGYTYRPATGRYHDAAGHPVPRAAIRAAVDAVIAGAKGELQDVAERLATGQLTLGAWQAHSAALLRSLHTVAATVGKGGWAQMTPADWGRVGHSTRDQYRYLAGFAADLATGAVGTIEELLNRAASYADAAQKTYEDAARHQATTAPAAPRIRNVLGVADHCPDCLHMTALGWVALDDPDFVMPGDRVCGSHCHCSLAYEGDA